LLFAYPFSFFAVQAFLCAIRHILCVLIVIELRRKLLGAQFLVGGAAPMNGNLEIRSYDYVNQPYERVRDALKQDAQAVFQSATKAAADRVRSVASELRVDVGGIGVKADIKITVTKIDEKTPDAMSTPTTRLLLEWEAANMPSLFPLMNAELSVYALTPTETQLDFLGVYEPPFGALGKAMNAIVAHRIAEASVQRFVSDVAAYLRHTLAE
jgi:hypothetical protein